MKRLAGLGLFGFAMGEGAVLAGQLAYGVSNKTLNSLKEFLPEWSKIPTSCQLKVKMENYIT